MKKALGGNEEDDDDDAESTVAATDTKVDNFIEGTKTTGNKTARDEAPKEPEEKSQTHKKSEDSLTPPRSHSLPNMAW